MLSYSWAFWLVNMVNKVNKQEVVNILTNVSKFEDSWEELLNLSKWIAQIFSERFYFRDCKISKRVKKPSWNLLAKKKRNGKNIVAV